VEPAFWAGFDRSSVDGFFELFSPIDEHEPKRAAKFGLLHFTWLCINPKNRRMMSLRKMSFDHSSSWINQCARIGEIVL